MRNKAALHKLQAQKIRKQLVVVLTIYMFFIFSSFLIAEIVLAV